METPTVHDIAAVQSVAKALSVMETLLLDGEALSARQIADRLGINRTTTHRLLNTLIQHGWVSRAEEGGYCLSIKFLALAHVSTQRQDFLTKIRPALVHLSELSRETVHVGVLDGLDIVHIDKIESLERVGVSSRIGTRGVALKSSLGKAIFAAMTDQELALHLDAIKHRDPAVDMPDPELIRQEVRVTRERGYAIDDEEDTIGVRCIGVAVRGPGGAPLFAISLTGPSPRFTQAVSEQLAPELIAIAADLSRRFGWKQPVAAPKIAS